MHKRLKDYFIGDILREEKDILRHANVVVIYYVMLLCLTLLIPLQILYIYTGNMLQFAIGIFSIGVFVVALLYLKFTKRITEISHAILVFSTFIFTLNMFMYPHMNIINGLLLACNIHFAFNLLGKKVGLYYVFTHLAVVVVYMVMEAEQVHLPFITPIIQPVMEQISAFVLLFIIIVVLILYYQSSHHKAAQQLIESLSALQLSEERRTKSQSVAHIGNWEFNIQTNEVFWDDEMYKIFGVPKTADNGYEAVLKMVHPEDKEFLNQSVQDALAGKQYNVDYRIVRPNREICVVNALGNIQHDSEGKLLRFYGSIQDISERKHAEEALRNLLDITSYQNTQLKNFAYIVSHNIRSHSANITSLVDFLLTCKNEAERNMMLGMLKSTSYKLDDTLKNLNQIITVAENISKPKEQKYLRTEISKTLDILNGIIYQHHIQVVVEVSSELTVRVIPSYLDSILLNLLSNAIKYRSPDHEALIQITAVRESHYIVMSVKDNGLGIDLQKNGSKIFGMYKTFHHNEDARGIGLFITKNHIEAMKGKIEVESQEHIGTIFKVYFNEKD